MKAILNRTKLMDIVEWSTMMAHITKAWTKGYQPME